MAENERHVEISLSLDASEYVAGAEQLVRANEQVSQSIQEFQGSFDPTIALNAAGFSQPTPPTGSPAAIPGGGFSASGGALSATSPFSPPPLPTGQPGGERHDAGTLPPVAPELFDAAGIPVYPEPPTPVEVEPPPPLPTVEPIPGGERHDAGTLPASAPSVDALPDTQAIFGSSEQINQLIEALEALTDSTKGEKSKEDRKKEEEKHKNLTEIIQFDAMMRLGRQVGQDVSQGHLFSAAGGGIGGALGLFGGSVGRFVGGGLSAAGGILDQIVGGTGGARDFEKTITDINQRFGLGNVNLLRNYNLGEQYGYTGVESARMIDRLRENRALDDPSQAGPLVSAIQEMTRALGLNAEATIEMAGMYSRTGGEKGAEGVRGYLADVVGGAIRAGFESNVQAYADMVGSARMQAINQTGQGVSDRAFNFLQDVIGGLTGGSSRTSELFRDNSQMAAMGLQSFLAMGGTANPYGTSAAYMRLAGINEANLDTRFNTAEQIAQNAQRSLGWTTGRLQEMSGMSEAEFQASARSDPNFIQGLLSGSVVMQRQTAHMVGGFLGREATANDLRAYEELTNIAAAHGGRLPMEGGSPDASRVDELLKQLQASPADQMRENEAARHNRIMEVMSSFMDLQTEIDEWMTGIMNWLKTIDLKKVQDSILNAMDGLQAFVKETVPKIEDAMDSIIAFFKNPLEPVETAAYQGAESLALAQANLWTLGGVGRAQKERSEWTSEQWEEERQRVAEANERGMNELRATPRWLLNLATWGAYGRELRRLEGEIHDSHNDTPGTITATPGYNTFRFAPGDVIMARQGGLGGATLTDVNLSLTQGMSLDIDQHQQSLEAAGLLQDVTGKMYEVLGKTQSHIENLVAKLFPGLLEQQSSLIDLTTAGNIILSKIEQAIPGVVAAIDAVKEAISYMAFGTPNGIDGAGGGTLRAFASGLFTGPRQFIGGSDSNHIDTKIRTDVSWEMIDQMFMQMATAYAEQNRRIEFSNAAVAGEVYDPSASQADRIALLQRAAAAHADRPGWHSFDYYIPSGNDPRSERPGTSSAGAEIMLPTLPGGRVEYGAANNYGNFANIYDAEGNLIFRTGHGDTRITMPSNRSFPTTPPSSMGSGIQLGSGYGSLEQLSQELQGLDPRFNTATPEGRAALALALGIGGTEVYSRGSTATDFFTRRGGQTLDGRRDMMLGFAQFNLDYFADETDTPAEYTRLLGDMLYGRRALPNGRTVNNVVRALTDAVRGGQIQSGAQLEQWLRQQSLGGANSNWQGIDDGWRRVPGLSDQLLRMLQSDVGAGRQVGNRALTNNITINIASANNRAEAEAGARDGIMAALPYLDEFEQRRQVDGNPRNRVDDRTLSPVYS